MVDNACTILILSDAFSGWPEAIVVPDRSRDTTIKVWRTVFARNGTPKTWVWDIASEYKTEKFTSWLRQIGCKPNNSPPYTPSSNGQAEMSHQGRTLKDALKTWNRIVPFHQILQKVLFTFRTGRPSVGRQFSPDLMINPDKHHSLLSMGKTRLSFLWMSKDSAWPIGTNGRLESGLKSEVIEPIPSDCSSIVETSSITLLEGESTVTDIVEGPETDCATPVTDLQSRYNLRKIPRRDYKV